MMEHGLIRIILIDSYMRGNINEVKVAGHTNMSGDNGKGKTSLIRLVPLFYGEYPSKITKKDETGNKSFAHYYLPRSGSYLIFEYLGRDGKAKMSVMTSIETQEDGFQQILIDTPFDQKHFINSDTKKPYPYTHLKATLRSSGVSLYTASHRQEYRNILMDGSIRGKERYSMVPPRTKLSRLIPLFTGMLYKDADFDVFRQIIADWTKSGLDSDANKTADNMNFDFELFASWVQDYDSYKELSERTAIFDKLADLIDERNEQYSALSAIFGFANKLKEGHLIELKTKKIEMSDYNTRVAREIDAFQTKSTHLKVKINEGLQRISALKASIQELESQKATLESKLSDKLVADIVNLPSHSSELDRKQERLRDLKDKTASIQAWFKEEQSKIQQEHHLQKENIRNEKDEKINQLAIELEESHRMRNLELENQRKESESEIAECEEKMRGQYKSIIEYEAFLKSPQVPLDIQEKLNLVRDEKDEQSNLVRDIANSEKRATAEYGKLVTKYNTLSSEYSTLNSQLDFLGEERRSVEDILYCKDGTFISFLKSNVPTWQSTIGRLVRKEVLQSNKLEPEFYDTDEKSIMGINIDIEALPPMDNEQSDEELQEEFDRLTKEIEVGERDLNELEKKMGRIVQRREEQSKEVELLKRNLSSAEKKMASIETTYSHIKHEAHEALETLKSETKSKLEIAQEKDAELDTKRINIKEVLAKSIEKIGLKYKNEQASIKSSQTQVRTQAELLLVEAKTKIELETSKLKDLRSVRLSDEGVSDKEFNSLENDIELLKTLIGKLHRLKDTQDRYNLFIQEKEQYPRKVELNKKLVKQTSDRKLLVSEQEGISLKISDLREGLSSKNEEWNAKFQHLENEVTRIGNIIFKAQDIDLSPLDDGPFTSNSLKLADQFDSTLKSWHANKHELKDTNAELVPLFKKRAGGRCHDYWYGTPVNDDDAIAVSNKLILFVRESHMGTMKDDLVGRVAFVNKLGMYRDHLKTTESHIKSFNRQLRENIADRLPFKAITEIKPTISFTTKEIEIYPYIDQVVNAYHSWREASNQELEIIGAEKKLPDHSMVNLIRELVDFVDSNEGNISHFNLAEKIKIQVTVLENGQEKHVLAGKSMANVSSNGLSYLTMLVLFLGFINLVRGDKNIHLVWALDELSQIDSGNINALLELLKDNKVTLLSACPEVTASTFSQFTQSYHFHDVDGVTKLIEDNSEILDKQVNEILEGIA